MFERGAEQKEEKEAAAVEWSLEVVAKGRRLRHGLTDGRGEEGTERGGREGGREHCCRWEKSSETNGRFDGWGTQDNYSGGGDGAAP